MKTRILQTVMVFAVALAALTACDNSEDNYAKATNANANKATYGIAAEVTRLEFPKLAEGTGDTVIVHKVSGFGRDGINYSIEWDCSKRAQRWTCYQMHDGNSAENWNRKNWTKTSWKGDPFQEDKSIPKQYRTTLADYRNSGYDRGHICPSADRLYSQDVNEQTFYMSNMHPQLHAFNAGIWDNMENQVRAWNVSAFRDTLFVCKGGTINSNLKQVKTHTNSGLIVPKYFFMAILCKKNGKYKAIAFWTTHTDTKSSDKKPYDYTLSIDELEKKTGIDFFCNLPDDIENEVERTADRSSWSWLK